VKAAKRAQGKKKESVLCRDSARKDKKNRRTGCEKKIPRKINTPCFTNPPKKGLRKEVEDIIEQKGKKKKYQRSRERRLYRGRKKGRRAEERRFPTRSTSLEHDQGGGRT